MWLTIIATEDGNVAKHIDNVLFDVSQIDETFKYKSKKYDGKVSFAIESKDKHQAYKRGLLIRNYVKRRYGNDIYFKVEIEK